MKLISVYYRYYDTPEVAEYIKYNAEIDTDTDDNTITAKLKIVAVDTQHLGLYECYARSLPADLYIDPDDYFYETSRNATLNTTTIGAGVLNLIGWIYYHCLCLENKPTDTPASSSHVTIIIVAVLSLLSAVTLVLIILLSVYIIRKRLMLKVKYCGESRVPCLIDESLVPISPDIPSESKCRQPSLVCLDADLRYLHYIHAVLCIADERDRNEWLVFSSL